MSSPAMCLYDREKGNFEFDNMLFYCYNSKKSEPVVPHNIICEPYPKDYTCNEQRFSWLCDYFYDQIPPNREDVHIALEDYAMRAMGRVFTIGENTGVLKNKLWGEGYSFETYTPSEIKKYATGKGNANKDLMYKAFTERETIDLISIFGGRTSKGAIPAPVTDLVDAYFVCDYLNYKTE